MDLANDLLQRILRQIPLTGAMGLSRLTLAPDRLTLTMPLAPNSNDKGTAFAGSTYGLLVLASWGLVTAILEQAGFKVPVVVASSTVDFRRPITLPEISAVAALANGLTPEQLVAEFQEKGQARPTVTAVIEDRGKLYCRFQGTFAART